MTSICSSPMNRARPSAPPNPPTLTCPAGSNGPVVRPASDVITSWPSFISRSASSRASPVPPSMRMRLRTADDFTVAPDNQHVGIDRGALQNFAHRSKRRLCNALAKVEPDTACKLLDFLSGVGAPCLVADMVRHETGEPVEVDLAAARVEIERALCELGDLSKSARHGDARHWVVSEIFEHAAGKVSHVDERAQRQVIKLFDGLLRCRARRSRNMAETRGARHIDAPMD